LIARRSRRLWIGVTGGLHTGTALHISGSTEVLPVTSVLCFLSCGCFAVKGRRSFMDRKFKRIVRNVIVERIDGICLEVMAKSKEYIRVNGRSNRLYDEFMEYLPDEAKELFLLYDESEAWLEGILQKAIYRNGLRDGIRLANICRKILKL
jgi:hypothetical protein